MNAIYWPAYCKVMYLCCEHRGGISDIVDSTYKPITSNKSKFRSICYSYFISSGYIETTYYEQNHLVNTLTKCHGAYYTVENCKYLGREFELPIVKDIHSRMQISRVS